MTPQDNSDDSLLVYADYLLDQGKDEESAWVRESINESPRKWEYEWLGVGGVGVGVGGVGGGVGGGGVGGVGVVGGVVGGGGGGVEE